MNKKQAKKVIERFMAKVQEQDNGCHKWTACTDYKGYGRILFKGTNQYAHRIAYQLFKGPVPEGMCVCHTCDNPTCVNPEHLFLGSHTDNMRDSMRKGRNAYTIGECNGNSKLSDEQVQEIRDDNTGRAQYVLASKYGVTQAMISAIRNGKTRRTRTDGTAW